MTPCSTSTVSDRSLKLSNSSGKIRYIHSLLLIMVVHSMTTSKKVVCSTSMLDEDIPVTVMMP